MCKNSPLVKLQASKCLILHGFSLVTHFIEMVRFSLKYCLLNLNFLITDNNGNSSFHSSVSVLNYVNICC